MHFLRNCHTALHALCNILQIGYLQGSKSSSIRCFILRIVPQQLDTNFQVFAALNALWLHLCSSAGHMCKNDIIDGTACEPTVFINFTHHSVPTSILSSGFTVAWA